MYGGNVRMVESQRVTKECCRLQIETFWSEVVEVVGPEFAAIDNIIIACVDEERAAKKKRQQHPRPKNTEGRNFHTEGNGRCYGNSPTKTRQ
jgi:hypothetical protein